MNVVIAIDSFKGSMTSLEAGESASAGIRRIYPDAIFRRGTESGAFPQAISERCAKTLCVVERRGRKACALWYMADR